MEFGILGPLSAINRGGPVPLGPPSERAVLARLLATPNRVVSAEQLADDVWGEEPPEGARATLRVKLSRIRRGLREAGDREDRITTSGSGYALAVADDELDALRFERLIADGGDELAFGSPATAATMLRAGLALWRGDPLAD